MRGSFVLLAISSALFLFGALCWGIFLSTVLRSQLLAYQISLLTSFLPAFLLSGFIYSAGEHAVDHPADLAHSAGTLLHRDSARHLSEGTGMTILWTQFLFLLIYAGVVLALAIRKLRPKLV